MADWDERRRCPGCPYDGTVDPGVRHIRCAGCRKDHTRAKAADAQWDRRARKRAADDAARRAKGLKPYGDAHIRPRRRTPTWDQYGREVRTPSRLTPAEAQDLRDALDALGRAVAQVRRALDPPR